jgi:hypothetical protein
MGGNIFGFTAKRFDKPRLLEIETTFSNFIKNNFPDTNWKVIPYYFSKKDFGDIDIAVEISFDKKQFIEKFLQESLINESNGIKTNSVSTSFLTIDNEQIDIIFLSKELYQCALTYYSWNDMGTFLGRIAKAHKLKYGFNGLYVDYIEDSVNYGEIFLTRDPKEIFECFGWDFETYNKGFNTLEDMFDYTISLHNFEPALYNFSEDELFSKRPVFIKFYEYLKSKNLLQTPRISKDEMNSARMSILKRFGKVEAFNALIEKAKHIKQYKLKFNGDICKEITGLSGVQLGNFIKHFKNMVSSEVVVSMSDEDVKKLIVTIHNDWRSIEIF